MAGARGVEPPTFRLTAGRSAVELRSAKGRVRRALFRTFTPHSGLHKLPNSIVVLPVEVKQNLVTKQSHLQAILP